MHRFCFFLDWPGWSAEVWAAWVQAVGSVVAIVAAFVIAARQARSDRVRREREYSDRARSLGLYLLPYLRDMSDLNNRIWGYEHPDHDVENTGPNECIAGPIALAAMRVPKALTERIGQLHELGPAARGITTAIYMTVRAQDSMSIDKYGRQLIFDKKEFYDRMWTALGGLTSALNTIEAQFPESHRDATEQSKE